MLLCPGPEPQRGEALPIGNAGRALVFFGGFDFEYFTAITIKAATIVSSVTNIA